MADGKRRAIIEGLVLVVISTLLACVGVAQLIFIAPLLLFAVSHGRKNAILLIVLEFFLLTAINLAMSEGLPSTKEEWALFLIVLYIPLSLSAAGITWLVTSGMGLMKRLFMSLLLPAIFLGAISAFIVTDRALSSLLFEEFRNAFAVMLGPVFGELFPSIDMDVLSYIVIIGILSFLMPVLFCGVCASAFIYETAKHSRESEWEEAVMRFSFPSDAVWGFIISWALVLLLRFVSVPVAVPVIVLNAAGVWTVIYAIQGFSIVYARVRKHSSNVRSMTVLIVLLLLGTVVPGINFIVLFGLPLLGVLGNFFDLKKLGVGNEDHS